MKKSFSLFGFIGFVFVSVLGTLLHFVYDWTNENFIASLFSGVNESTWEHMKLLFFPLFVFAVIQWFFFKERNDYWCVKLIGTVSGLLLIPVIFYTYNGVFGKSPDWVNISIFFVSTALVFILETWLFRKSIIYCRFPILSFIVLCVIGALFFVFTFYPPQIPLFMDPITGIYGV
jgi:hypothetical protein